MNKPKKFWLIIIFLITITAILHTVHASRPITVSMVVHSICQAILIYGNDNEDMLPKSLEDLLPQTYLLPEEWEISLDSFIYVAPDALKNTPDALSKFPGDTPIVIFPYQSGIHVGYLSGRVSFLSGGIGGDTYSPTYRMEIDRLETQLNVTRILAAVFLLLLVGALLTFWRYNALTNRGR